MNVEKWLDEHPAVLHLGEKLNLAIVGVTLNDRIIYDYATLVNLIAVDFSLKDEGVYTFEEYEATAKKYVDEIIMEELEYDSDSPLIIQLFEGV